jgi:hypothetical protein
METWTAFTAGAVLLAAQGLYQIENLLDQLARGLADWAWGGAGLAERAESGFDWIAQGAGWLTMRTAQAAETSESQAFGEGLNRFAGLFNRSGRQLRRLQTGKLYLYTLALFLWVLVAGGLSVLIIILH